MSYGTILLMALICFMLGGTERMPWAAVDETAGEVFAPAERIQTEIVRAQSFTDEPNASEPSLQHIATDNAGALVAAVPPKGAAPEPLFKAPPGYAAMNFQGVYERQQHALLRYYANEDASAYECRQMLMAFQKHPGCTIARLTCAPAP